MRDYQLRYLPQFYQDIEEHTLYISRTLKNPQAAKELLEAAEIAILERRPHAEAFEQYHSRKERKYPYYRIYVKNFVIFYVVIPEGNHKVMEIRRFLYGKSNWKRKI
ncbi:MAG: type II toxin-antitoxin system RelE/ParE family toxin [Clostridia bacterium]|nr:type II toxin-antitoxin system RelE/ParE family toxin [Clostridia bacterium]